MGRRLRSMVVAVLVAGLMVVLALGINARSNDNAAGVKKNRTQLLATQAEVQALKDLQVQELATFNLLKDTVERFTGPNAQKAQDAATKAFIDEILKRIEAEDAALLAAIQGGSHVIVTPGPTKTVCRTPAGKPC